MSVRNILLVLNGVALLVLVVYLAVAAARTPEKPASNQTPFFPDEELEGRHLERVLGWSLTFAALIAVALPLYWLREPYRQDESIVYFDEAAVERGAVLFANAAGEHFDSAKSLLCADCHGAEGAGGSANYVYTPPDGGPSLSTAWKAPALNTVLLRFSPEEVKQIITYGRPGTPMNAWGVAGGGPKNEQSVDDLVAFIESFQISSEEAKAEAATALADSLAQPRAAVDNALQAVKDAKEAYEDALAKLAELEADPAATEQQIADAQAAVDDGPASITAAEKALDWAWDWVAAREDVTEGQVLFETYCARCHTKNWSIFDPTRVDGADLLGLAGGGGTLGFNLRDGANQRRFGEGDEGAAAQVDFIRNGSEANQPYGIGGIGSGRMPGFGSMLTDEQIEAIVEYEREDLDQTDYAGVGRDESEE